MCAYGERRPSGGPEPVAVHGLLAVGAAGYWWQDAESGARLLRGDASGVREVALPQPPDGLTALAVHPADTGPGAALYGYPGGDYGYLTEAGAPDRVLARRPALVRLPRVPSATGGPAGPGFVYTGFPPDARLEDPRWTGSGSPCTAPVNPSRTTGRYRSATPRTRWSPWSRRPTRTPYS